MVEARGYTGAPGSIGEIQVACSQGRDFLRGGYFSDSGIEVARVFRNYAWDQWYNTFTSVEANQQVGVRAMCASLPASSRYEVVEATTTTGAPGSLDDVQVSCPQGTRILGGGYFSDSGVEVWRVFRNYPSGDTWNATFTSVMPNQSVGVRSICADLTANNTGTGTGPIVAVPSGGCTTFNVPGQPYTLTGQQLYSPQTYSLQAGRRLR